MRKLFGSRGQDLRIVAEQEANLEFVIQAELVRGLAFLGVACSVENADENLRRIARDQAINFDETRQAFRDIEERKGFPILVEHNEHTLALI